jgi:hypothetical protein
MKLRHLTTVAALLFISGQAASAQTATQDVTITVTAVDQISVSASSVAISVGVGSTTDNSTSYSVTTNSGDNRSITGQITTGADFPTGLTLTVALTAPTVGTSDGAQPLVTATAATLVHGIHNVTGTGLQISYVATATVAASAAALTARTITYTIQ